MTIATFWSLEQSFIGPWATRRAGQVKYLEYRAFDCVACRDGAREISRDWKKKPGLYKTLLVLPVNSLKPPRPDELELSLFGPGIGECAVLHLGAGEWIIVDSCVNTENRRPVAVDYLKGIGADLRSAVRAIVITHWHDDHVRGISEIVRECPQAGVYCSAALNRLEFCKAIEVGRQEAPQEASGVDEFRRVFDVLLERREGARIEAVGPHWVNEGSLIHRRTAGNGIIPVEVLALSPSPATMKLALHDIARLIPTEGSTQVRAVSVKPNETAIVLWVQAGKHTLLLGADLEASPRADIGWKAVVRAASRPPKRATVLKVPHHGSRNADEPLVWTQLLEPGPLACLTPFTKSGLPTQNDRKRLLAQTESLYCTAPPEGWRPTKRGSTVEKIAREVARSRKTVTGAMGHIRYRAPLVSDGGAVELFSGAFRVAA